jgi:hypothetical protein
MFMAKTWVETKIIINIKIDGATKFEFKKEVHKIQIHNFNFEFNLIISCICCAFKI